MYALAFWPFVKELDGFTNSCEACSCPDMGGVLREAWGCDGPSKPSKKGGDRFIYNLGPITTDRCPLALMKQPFVAEAARLFHFFDKGITPQGCGLMDETATYNDTMPLLKNLISQAESDYHKKLNERQKSKNRGR